MTLKGWKRSPATLALVGVVLLAAWMGDSNGGYFVGDWALAGMALAALVLFLSIGLLKDARPGRSMLALGLFAAYTAWAFASLLWSPNVGDAWLGAGQTLLYLLVFWTALSLAELGASRRWALASSVLGPAAIAASTLSVLGSRFESLFEKHQLIGTVGYHNGEAAFLLTSFWVAVYLGSSRHVSPFMRGAVLASAVLCLNLAVLTQSRGAMVAMAVSLPVFFIVSGQRLRGLTALLPIAVALLVAFPYLNEVYLASLVGKDPTIALERASPVVWLSTAGAGLYGVYWGFCDRWWRPRPRLTRFAGGGALVCVALVLVIGASVMGERFGNPLALAQQKWEAFRINDVAGQETSRYLSASGTGRFELWQVAWKDFTADPLQGIGTHNFEATYYQLRERDTGFARQPHSLPLEVLGERGLVGGVVFFGFLTLCLTAGLWERFRHLGPEGKAQVGALVAAATYWFVHSSAEWFWQLPTVTLPVFAYLALLISPWQDTEDMSIGTSSRWMLRAGGVAVAALSLAVFSPLYVADRYLEQSYTAKASADSLAAVEQAQRFNPLDARLREREAELAAEVGDWDRVKSAYGEAIRLNPEHYAPYMYLAAFYEQRGELDEARYYYRRALVFNPLNDKLDRHVNQLQ